MKIDELMRLAFIYAEQDREGYLDAIANTSDEREKDETEALIEALREYRLRRWGRTRHESLMARAETKTVEQIRKDTP